MRGRQQKRGQGRAKMKMETMWWMWTVPMRRVRRGPRGHVPRQHHHHRHRRRRRGRPHLHPDKNKHHLHRQRSMHQPHNHPTLHASVPHVLLRGPSPAPSGRRRPCRRLLHRPHRRSRAQAEPGGRASGRAHARSAAAAGRGPGSSSIGRPRSSRLPLRPKGPVRSGSALWTTPAASSASDAAACPASRTPALSAPKASFMSSVFVLNILREAPTRKWIP